MADKQFRYKETQAMMPPMVIKLVILMLIIIMGLFGYMYIAQEFLELEVGENALPPLWALAIFILTALLTYYVANLKINIKVDDRDLMLGLGVIGKRSFPLDKIRSVELYEGSPAKDFLGYGYRVGLKKLGYVGRAPEAIAITFEHFKRTLVVTTKDPEALIKSLKDLD
ncbi:YdbT family protein [Kangiella spongicola]|uniref:Bacterial Pleckstrin homology domain-containing protein n=1 Tax=Kangiella spongicola TaxID=796379 RepID=A0A318D7K1_9GAMM|nr:hypothetical protein [Kangiella spongicola]PXF63174.1 hypothetical protein DL796_06925 [Kangiella spongicola]